jgi:hypothetical protein
LTLTSRGQHSALPYLRIPDCLFDTKTTPSRTGTRTSSGLLNSKNTDLTKQIPLQNNSDIISWGKANEGLKKAEKELTAESYVRYLRMYARRFGLDSAMKLGCSVVKVSRLSAQKAVCDKGEGQGGGEGEGGDVGGNKGVTPPLTDLWEIQYSYINNTGIRELAVIYSKFVVVACGKAQIPITDKGLTKALEGFSGQTVYAKDVKDIEGTWISDSAIISF